MLTLERRKTERSSEKNINGTNLKKIEGIK